MSWHSSLSEQEFLLEIAAVLASSRTSESLERRLTSVILEFIPAERCAVLVCGEEIGEFEALFGSDRSAVSDRPAGVSRAIVDEVLHDGRWFLFDERSAFLPATHVAALAASPIKSVLAVPMLVLQRMRGVVYLDSTDPSVHFNENLARVLAAAGSMIGLAMDHLHVQGLRRAEALRMDTEIIIGFTGGRSRRRGTTGSRFLGESAVTEPPQFPAAHPDGRESGYSHGCNSPVGGQ